MTYKKSTRREEVTEQDRWEQVVAYAKDLLADCDDVVGDYDKWERPEYDPRAPLAVLTYGVKRVQLEVGGPTTFIEFWFTDPAWYDLSTVFRASLFTNRFSSDGNMQEFQYFEDEAERLFKKYSMFVLDRGYPTNSPRGD